MLPGLVRWRGYPAFLIKLSAAILISCTLAVAPVGADTLRVPAQFATIQAAIDAAVDGDTILVAAGTYNESLEWRQKNLQLIGAGPKTTVIDATGTGGSCLHMVGAPATARVEGFTFTGGAGTNVGPPSNRVHGGGIFLDASRGTITGNVIAGNRAERGGGLGILGGSPAVVANTVRNNSATNFGGGVFVTAQGTTLVNNVITNNSVDFQGGGVFTLGSLLVVGNVIARNSASQLAAGLLMIGAGGLAAYVDNNTITANTGGVGGGAFVAVGVYHIRNCIIAGNGVDLSHGASTSLHVSFSDVETFNISAPVEWHDNISADPGFVNAAAGDYRLREGSPSVNTGSNAAVLPDVTTDVAGAPRIQDGTVDMGAYEGAVDMTPPTINGISATPNLLWPANNKMVPVKITVDATDNDGLVPASRIVNVACNEGPVADWWTVTGDLTLDVRAARYGFNQGRVYTITIESRDKAGNTATGTTTVTVPHDQRKK